MLKLMSDQQLKSISYHCFIFFFFYLGEILTGEANGLFCLKQIFKQWFLRDTNNYLKKMLTLHLRARDWAYEIRTQEN